MGEPLYRRGLCGYISPWARRKGGPLIFVFAKPGGSFAPLSRTSDMSPNIPIRSNQMERGGALGACILIYTTYTAHIRTQYSPRSEKSAETLEHPPESLIPHSIV